MSFINKRIQFGIRVRRNGRQPSGYPLDGAGIPLRITQYIPMKLKDVNVDKLKSNKEERDVVCIPEMMSLFDCYEKHDFSPRLCLQQAKALEKCFTTHKSMVLEMKAKNMNKVSGDGFK